MVGKFLLPFLVAGYQSGAIVGEAPGPAYENSPNLRTAGKARPSVNAQMHDLSDKFDRRTATLASARSTNWTAFYSTAAAVIGVAVVVGGLAIEPISDDLGKTTSTLEKMQASVVLKEDFRADTSDIRDRFRVDEDAAVT